MDVPSLPFVDEHSIEIGADRAAIWSALVTEIAAAFGSRRAHRVARILGCSPQADAEPPTDPRLRRLAGFEGAREFEPSELTLVGRHRHARYALTFHIDDGTRLTAITHAEFPRLDGRLYRALVIGSGGHAILVRRMLRHVRDRAERAT